MGKIILSIGILLFCFGDLGAQKKIDANELIKWDFYGTGIAKVDHNQIYMSEAVNSDGVMLVSPNPYPANVIMRYEIMPLTAATVCVAILNAHNREGYSYTVPKQYNGYVQHWTQDMNAYFFAFHNASHNWTPFLQKARATGEMAVKLDIAKENVMQVGKYYTIEVGKNEHDIWLKVDGVLALEAKDTEPYNGGHLALRIRGTSWNLASCLIRNLEVEQ